jgi:hypothetical protein
MVTDQLRTGFVSNANLPAAHLPRHQSVRQAEHVILWLLLIGLTAALLYVTVDLVLAWATVGPHPLGPLPHPHPVTNPSPVPPES